MIWFVTRSYLIAGAQHVLFCFVFVLKGQDCDRSVRLNDSAFSPNVETGRHHRSKHRLHHTCLLRSGCFAPHQPVGTSAD